MKKTPRILALLVAVTFAVAGCAEAPEPGPEPDAAPETVEATPEPSKPAFVNHYRAEDPKRYNVGQEIAVSSVQRWEIQPGKGMNRRQALAISARANVFIQRHLMRAGRFQGKYLLKEGEADSLRGLTHKKTFNGSMKAIEWLDRTAERHGGDESKWPKKARERWGDEWMSASAFMFTRPTTRAGTGPVEHEITRRVMYVPDNIPWPTSYISFTTRRINGSDSLDMFATLEWEKVKGEWVIRRSRWRPVED